MFNGFSPTDFRYYVKDMENYLSEEAYIRYKAMVESKIAETYADFGVFDRKIAEEIENACKTLKVEEVYEEEKRIKHDIRALVNVIKRNVSKEAKPYVHLAATSYDIVDTANALRIKDAIINVLLPDLLNFEKALIELALREKSTVKIGRTHGQHAEPVTFGFEIAQYVERVGDRTVKIFESVNSLVGKFSGAVGTYAALSLVVDDPEDFEKELLSKLRLKPAKISTQIVPAEPRTDLFHFLTSLFGVIANLADDMRHLQRTEIDEVSESFGKEQVGSSTMPHKKNPINFENAKSAWKTFFPRMVTVYMDQISEHERDLTNSLSQRYLPEVIVMLDSTVRRVKKTIEKFDLPTRKDIERLEKKIDDLKNQ